MNKYDPLVHHRRSIRLTGYDYSQEGLYFITLCCWGRICHFGRIEGGQLKLNDSGRIASECWKEIPKHFPDVALHEYIVMPNHLHGIIELKSKVAGAENLPPVFNEIAPNEIQTHGAVGAENLPPGFNEIAPNEFLTHDIAWAENLPPGINDVDTETGDRMDAGNMKRANNDSPLRSPSKTVGSIVRGFKIGVTKWMRANTDVREIWQRNYYEHIIRDERSYQKISDYIVRNPSNWPKDKLYKE